MKNIACMNLLLVKQNKWYGHTAHTFSHLLSDILIWKRFISISSRFQMFDNNTISCWFNNIATETIDHVYVRARACMCVFGAHSPTLLSLHLHHSSFSNPFVALPTSQLIPPTLPLLQLRHSSFFNPSFAFPTSQAFHLCHLVSHQSLIVKFSL